MRSRWRVAATAAPRCVGSAGRVGPGPGQRADPGPLGHRARRSGHGAGGQGTVGRERRAAAVGRPRETGHHLGLPVAGVAGRRSRVAPINTGRLPVGGRVPGPRPHRFQAGDRRRPGRAVRGDHRVAGGRLDGPHGVGAGPGTALGVGMGSCRADPGPAPAGGRAGTTAARVRCTPRSSRSAPSWTTHNCRSPRQRPRRARASRGCIALNGSAADTTGRGLRCPAG